MKLTKKQLTSIGYDKQQQIPIRYWNQQISNCFKPFNTERQNLKYLDNQTFKDFIDMDLSGPNQQGSGRYHFQQISQIKFSIVQKKTINHQYEQSNSYCQQDPFSKKNQLQQKKSLKKSFYPQNDTSQKTQKMMQKFHQLNKKTLPQDFTQTPEFSFSIRAISQILTKFFQIPASYDSSIHLSIDSATNNLVDEKSMIEYQLKQKYPKKQNKRKELPRPTYDVWELIDIGIEYKNDQKHQKNLKNSNQQPKSKQTIYLFLIEADLLEDDQQIDGRATGDGVAFVSFNKEDFAPIGLKNQFLAQQFPCYTLPILIHQCLHTLGFDHCSGWECLMNSITNEQFLLCPGCARKLESQFEEKQNLKNWYLQMAKTLKHIKTQMKQSYGAQKCIKMFVDILYSKSQLNKKEQGQKKALGNQINLIEAKQCLQVNDQADSDQIGYKPSSMLQKCLYIERSI